MVQRGMTVCGHRSRVRCLHHIFHIHAVNRAHKLIERSERSWLAFSSPMKLWKEKSVDSSLDIPIALLGLQLSEKST